MRRPCANIRCCFSGDSALPSFDESDVGRLRRHLSAGGLLIIDGAEAHPGGAFDQSVRALVKRVFPKEDLAHISPEHVLYKSFYLLRTPVGRVAAVPFEGVEHDGRLVIVYSQNDMGGAWLAPTSGSGARGRPRRLRAARDGVPPRCERGDVRALSRLQDRSSARAVHFAASSVAVEVNFDEQHLVSLAPWGRLGLALAVVAALIVIVLAWRALRLEPRASRR